MSTRKYDELMERYADLAQLGKAQEIAIRSAYEGVKVYLLWEADADSCERCNELQGEVREAALWDVQPPLHPNCECMFSIRELEFVKPFAKRITFDGRNLVVYDQYDRAMYRTTAESGRVGYQESQYQDVKDTGPLPEGAYALKPDELSDPGFIGDHARRLTGDWGDWRVRLHEQDPTMWRSGFFLHGGDDPGSAGCIEYENFEDATLKRLIEESPFEIEVEVDYANDKACTP